MDLHRGIVVLRKLSIALDLYEQVEEIYTAFYVWYDVWWAASKDTDWHCRFNCYCIPL